jgi:hypothetical protein
MMIVRTIQQEDDCSWQDARNSWMGQDEDVTAGVYQVRTCQVAAEQPTVGQCKKASITEGDEKASELDDLLLEGEEQEYFLELLMRKASPERPEASQPAKDRGNSKSEAATAKGKEKKGAGRKRGKLLRRVKRWRRLAGKRRRRGQWAKPAGRGGRQLLIRPTIQRPRAEDWLRASERRRSK